MVNYDQKIDASHLAANRGSDSWLHRNRYIVVVTLVFALAAGLWSVRQMILDDYPRMEPWQKVFFWLGDIGALVYAVRWMISRDDVEDVRPQIFNRLAAAPKKIVVIVAIGLILDTVATLVAMFGSYQSMHRAVPTQATVISSEVTSARKRSTYYRQVVEFQDQQGKPYTGWVKFRTTKGHPLAPWKLAPLEAAKQPNQKKKVDVIYDPEQPNRVWLDGQTWDKTAGLEPLFAVIHVFQCLVVWSAVKELTGQNLPNASSDVDLSAVPMLPLAIEAFCLAMGGVFLNTG